MGNIIDILKNDEEISELKERYHEITGEWLAYHYDCYFSIEEYKEHLRECIRAGKYVIRPKDEAAAHRFDSDAKKNQENYKIEEALRNELRHDKEAKELQMQIIELIRHYPVFNYDCYHSIEEYKEHLRECIRAGEIIMRPNIRII